MGQTDPEEKYAPERPLRVLIVDDEPIARKLLRQELDCFGEVEVVGEADNGEKALLESPSYNPISSS